MGAPATVSLRSESNSHPTTDANNLATTICPEMKGHVEEPSTHPWVYWSEPFLIQFDSNGAVENMDSLSDQLANACKALLDWIERAPAKVQEKYRFELVPKRQRDRAIPGQQDTPIESSLDNDGLWFLGIKLDFVSWVDCILVNGSDTRDDKMVVERLKVARNFVLHMRKLPGLPLEQATIDGSPCSVGEYCRFGNDCKHRNDCKKHHAPYYCMKPVPLRGGGERPCGWYPSNELMLTGLVNDSEWFLLSRRDPQRDIILFPRTHRTNRELVISKNFWETILKLAGSLREVIGCQAKSHPQLSSLFEAVKLNFGLWESQSDQEQRQLPTHKRMKDCHGHAHIDSTLNMHERMKQKDSWRKQLVGRFNPPEDYTESDLVQLEARLSSIEIAHVSSDVTELKADVTELKATVGSLSGSVATLNTKVDDLTRMFHSLLAVLHQNTNAQ